MHFSLKQVKLLVLMPAFIACFFDVFLTAVLQPADYWEGHLEMANEGNPLVFFAMNQHELGLFVVLILWLALLTLIGYFLPYRLLKILSLGVLVGHSWGASTWLEYFYGFGYVIILFIINATIFILLEEKVALKIKLIQADTL